MADVPLYLQQYFKKHGLKYALKMDHHFWWANMWDRDEWREYPKRHAIIFFFPPTWEVHFVGKYLVTSHRISKERYKLLMAFVRGLIVANYFEN